MACGGFGYAGRRLVRLSSFASFPPAMTSTDTGDLDEGRHARPGVKIFWLGAR